MVLEAFLVSSNTSVALSKLSIKHAKGQSAVSHSDNVAQPAELAMVEHGFHRGNASP